MAVVFVFLPTADAPLKPLGPFPICAASLPLSFPIPHSVRRTSVVEMGTAMGLVVTRLT